MRAPSGSGRARSRTARPRPPPAAHLDRERRAREPGPDRRGGIGAGRAVGELERLAVGECDRDRHRSAGGYSRPTPAAGRIRSGGLPERVVAERDPPQRARRRAARPAPPRRRGGRASTLLCVMIAATSCVTRPSGKLRSASSGSSARRARARASGRGSRSARRRPRSSGSRPPPGDARRVSNTSEGAEIAHRPVGLARLALEVRGAALGRARLAPCRPHRQQPCARRRSPRRSPARRGRSRARARARCPRPRRARASS